jgi:hypothetical protein
MRTVPVLTGAEAAQLIRFRGHYRLVLIGAGLS